MKTIRKLVTVLRVLARGRRNQTDAVRWLGRRPAIMAAVFGYESGLLLSSRAPTRLKLLAQLRTSSLVGCPFWMDIGSAVSRASGISDEELMAVGRYRDSDLFSPLDKLVMDLATQMTRTPAEVDDSLRESLLEHLSPAQLTEIVATVAWENHRARLNRALGVREAGFSDGAFCVVPAKE